MPYTVSLPDPSGWGTAAAGADIAKNIRRWKDETAANEQKQATSDTVMAWARDQGKITEEQYAKYQTGNQDQKIGIAFGVMSNEHAALQQQQQEQQAKELEARIAALSRQNEQFQPTAVPLTDPVTGKQATFYTQSRGSVAPFPGQNTADLPAAGTPAYAPDGSFFGVYDAKGKIVKPAAVNPLQAEIAAQMHGTPTPPPAAQPSPGNPQTDVNAAAAQIKADFSAGKLPREEALRRLQQLGFQ